MGAYSTPVSWQGYKELVRKGLAVHEIPVGSQIIDTWAEVEGTNYTCPWDVVHYDAQENAYLKWHYGFKTDIAFDAPEAIYYAPTGGLAAGQYYIQIKTAYGSGWVVDQCINFTLESAMEEGDQLVLSTATSNNNNPTNGMRWDVYAKGSTTSKANGTERLPIAVQARSLVKHRHPVSVTRMATSMHLRGLCMDITDGRSQRSVST